MGGPQLIPVVRPAHHAWSLAGTTAALACQWLLLAVVARAGGPEAAGRFAIALALTGPVMLFAGLGLRHAQMADPGVAARLPTYIVLRGLALLAATAVIILGATFGPYGQATASAILMVGVAKAGESAGEVTYGYLQRRGRFDLVATSQLSRGLLGLAGLLIGFGVGGLGPALGGLAAGWVLSVLVADVPNLKREPPSGAPGTIGTWPRATDLQALLRTTLPLGVVALLWSTAINLPRYALEAGHGPASLGRFAAAASLLVPAGAVANAIGQSGARALALRVAKDRAAAAREGWRWAVAVGCGLAGLVFLGGFLAGPWVLRAAFGSEFAMSRRELVPYLAAGGAASVATLFDYLILAAGRFRTQLLLGTAVWLATAILVVLLVPDRGAPGAALAIALSAGVHLMLAATTAWRLGAGEGT
jgi:O-antigen/teichoic acid export membrane protein